MPINKPKILIECVVPNYKQLVSNIVIAILSAWTGQRGGGALALAPQCQN